MVFHYAPENEWFLSDSLRDERGYLWDSPTFEQIAERIALEASVIKISEEHPKKIADNTELHEYKRVEISISLHKETVDLFHNSRSGYRAQYYHSIENGERANRYLLIKLSTLILGEENSDWQKASLTHDDAKVWIHQGPWLRPKRGMKKHRNLNVPRWCQKTEKWAHWSKLTPLEEKIIIKGAYLDNAGNEMVAKYKIKPRAERSKRLHEYGYT